MAADLAPPKRVVSHAHWTVGRVKVRVDHVQIVKYNNQFLCTGNAGLG